MAVKTDKQADQYLFEYLLRLGDDRLILGHRLSEWCGHGPILEEDIALANIALDCLGQANNFLQVAGQIESKGRTPDDLAFLREAIEFRNLMLVEQENGDFSTTIARQFLFDAFSVPNLEKLQLSKHSDLAGVAAKSLKESRYHLRHSREWVLRLGDGTVESHTRIQRSFDDLWTYTDEMFFQDDVDKELIGMGIAVDLEEIRPQWKEQVLRTLKDATIEIPDNDQYMSSGSRTGVHSEHLGHLLSEMQILARSFPGASW